MAITGRKESAMDSDEQYIESKQTVELDDGKYRRISIFDEEGLVTGIEYEEGQEVGYDLNEENAEAYVRDQNGEFREISSEDFRKIHDRLADNDLELTGNKLSGTKTADTFKR